MLEKSVPKVLMQIINKIFTDAQKASPSNEFLKYSDVTINFRGEKAPLIIISKIIKGE